MNNLNQAENFLDNCILITVVTHGIGNRKSVSSSLVEVDAELDALSVSKELLKSDQLAKINSHFSMISRYMKKMCRQSFLKSGLWACPLENVEEVMFKLEMFQQELPALVRDFIDVYEIQRDNQRNRLRSLYNPRDYPDVEVVERAFWMEFNTLEMKVPGELNRISPYLFKQQMEKFNKQVAEAVQKMDAVLAAETAQIVDSLVEQLTPDSTNEKKVIRPQSLDKVKSFIANYEKLNVNNNEDLQGLINQMDDLLNGVDCPTLKKNVPLRESLREGFEQVRAQLSNMMEDAPMRMVDFDD